MIGYGKDTVGGSGGRVYEVTEPGDGWGPGTLRHAAEQPGPKIIDVRVPRILMPESLFTPRQSASLTTWEFNGCEVFGNLWPALYEVDPVHDIIIRNGRFMGPSTLGPRKIHGSEGDSVCCYRIRNLFVDSCTVAGGIDECLGLQHCGEFTVRRLIQTEAASHGDGGQYHRDGEHNYGAMSSNITGNGTWIECLFANSRMRMPEFDGPHRIELVNCFMYNFEKMVSESNRVKELTVEGCVWKTGPNSRAGTAPGTHQLLRDMPDKPVAIIDCIYDRDGDIINSPVAIHELGMANLHNGFVEKRYGETIAPVSADKLLSHLREVAGPDDTLHEVEKRAFDDAENRTGGYGVRYELPDVPPPLEPRSSPEPTPEPDTPAPEKKWRPKYRIRVPEQRIPAHEITIEELQ